MLKSLYIQNYALIRQLDVKFSDGFTVITGETGAGKSILLGAIGLLMGQRADHDVLFNDDAKCLVEGHFDISGLNMQGFFSDFDIDFDDHCIIRREISPQGKSRAFINDTPVNLSTMRELASSLIDVHSQHESLLLQSAGFQLRVVDGFIKKNAYLHSYKKLYQDYISLKKESDSLIHLSSNLQKERDFKQFLFDELQTAQLSPNELSELESEIGMLSNAESILKGLQEATYLLSDTDNASINQIRRLISLLSQLSSYSPAFIPLTERTKSVILELEDVLSELNIAANRIEFNPTRLSQLTDRLDLINRLLHKHQVETIDELLTYRNTLDNELLAADELGDRISLLTKELDSCRIKLQEHAELLHESRISAASEFSSQMKSLIRQLGMPYADFSVEVHKLDAPGPDGISKVNMLFSANKGGRLLDLSQVASGGELSRVMLSLKSLLADKKFLPTIVFDEIDNGVSGEIAARVGSILRKMSERHQLIVISHLPQVAAKGHRHVLVYKQTLANSTETKLKELSDEERVEVIAGMLGDEKVSMAAAEAARELLGVQNKN